MKKKSSGTTNIQRFTIKAVGTSRTEDQVRQDVDAALHEALEAYRSQSDQRVRADAEPEGPFTGVEIAAFWLLKTFVGGAIGGTGAIAGKKLYKFFAASLKKRNLDPGKPTVVKPKPTGKVARKKS